MLTTATWMGGIMRQEEGWMLTTRMGGIMRQEEGWMLTARRRVEYYRQKGWKGVSSAGVETRFKRLIFVTR